MKEQTFNSARIKELREVRGLTQEAFAKRIGGSKQLVSSWEAGDTMPQIKTLLKICTIFGVPITFFIRKGEVSPLSNGASF